MFVQQLLATMWTNQLMDS